MNFSLFYRAGRYVAVLEYAHLSVKLDLQKAIGKVREACENIQRTTEHVRRKVEGMDVHAMMMRQERLCMSFAKEMYSQLYALGKEVHVKGIPDPFQMQRKKRRFGDGRESYGERLRRLHEENYSILLDGPKRNRTVNGVAYPEFCGMADLKSEERSDYLQVRCDYWFLPELVVKKDALQYTPEGLKIFQHWQETHDVYYLRRNLQRYLDMKPYTKEQLEYMQQGGEDDFEEDPKGDPHQTDGQFLFNEGVERLPMPPPQVKDHATDGVMEHGGGVVQGVPAEGEVKFFGFPDYESAGGKPSATNGPAGDANEGGLQEEYDETEYEDYEESEEEDDSGMSLLEKAILVGEIGIMGHKVKGMISGKKEEGDEDVADIADAVGGGKRKKLKDKGKALVNKSKAKGKALVNKSKKAGKGLVKKGKDVVGKGLNKARGAKKGLTKGIKKGLSKGKTVKKGLGKGTKLAKGLASAAGRIFRGKRSTEYIKGVAFLIEREEMRVKKSRKRRQLLAVGATLLGGYVINDKWNWLKSELGIGEDNVDSGLVHQVQGNDDHLRILGTHVDGLEKATLKLRQQVTVGRMDEVMLIMFEQVVGLMEEIKDQYGRLYDAINLLISRKRLSTSLASPPEVYREVANVAGRLKKQDLALLIEESQEVYETDASYILFENMTLAILVHLPVGRLGESMRLYRYLPTPFQFENRTNLFTIEPARELLAASDADKDRQIELSGVDFENCDLVRSTYYCPGTTQWSFDTRESCLSALFRRDAPVIQEKCAISPIPHDDMAVQLDEKTFVIALEKEEIFRFACSGQQITTLKLSGLIRITVPRGCVAEGNWMKLMPTHDLYFNLGRLRVVKVLPLEMVNTTATDWAVKSGKFTVGGGESGPSVDDLMKSWKVNDLKEKRHFSLWTLIKRTFWSIMIFLIVFVVIQIGWKCFEMRMVAKKFIKSGQKVKLLFEEKDRLLVQMKDNMSYIKSLSDTVLGRRPATANNDPTATEEEGVRLSELPTDD